MATEYKLSYTATEIDEKLGKIDNTICFTSQKLTEEQKTQARENIGIIDSELLKYISQISKRAHFVSSAGYVLSIDTDAMTVEVPDGYMFIRNHKVSDPSRFTIKKTVCAINVESAFSFVVVNTQYGTVLSINPANFDSTKQVMIAVLWKNYYTNPSANWVFGPYKVNGYVYNDTAEQPVYVSTTGSDSAIGDRNHPFKTIRKAIASGAKTIFVFAGIYKESISVSRIGDEIEILAKPLNYVDKDVVIDLGTELTMAADTATGLVKASFASTSDDFIRKAFVSKTETLIYADSFNTDGYACNLWCGDTKLTPVLSLAECQATSGTWFYDGAYVYANSDAGTYTLADGAHNYGMYFSYLKKVKLIGIEVRHAKHNGVMLEGCTDAEISRCKFGYTGLYNGLAMVNTSAVVRNCEAKFNRTDGLNVHGVSTADFIDCVSHDNGDDGISHHEESGGMVIGGECYNNGKGGVCSPTFGSRNSINGVYIHDNANGVFAVTDTEGNYPQCTVSNCAIVNNTNGIRSSRYTLNCWNNILSGNTRDVLAENGGVINIIQ